MKFHFVSDVHYWTDSRSVTLGKHDLTMNEYGAWECDCPRYAYKKQCAHTDALCEQLYCKPALSRATKAVKASLAQGVGLEQLYDFSSYAAPYPITRRGKVVSRPLELPVVCQQCGANNPAGAQMCRLCGDLPLVGSLQKSA